MEDLLLPFRRNSKEKDEKAQGLKESVGTDIAIEHKAQVRIREADLEFEKAFAEVMGLAFGGEKKKEEQKAQAEKKELIEKKELVQAKEKKPPEAPAKEEKQEKKWPGSNRESGLRAVAGQAREEMELPKPAAQKPDEKKEAPVPAEIKAAEKKEEFRPAVQKAEEKKEIVQKVLAEIKAQASAGEEKIADSQKQFEPKEVDLDLKKKQQEKWSAFNFWYSDRKAASYAEFRDAIKAISDQSLEHHAQHNDFSKYLREFYDKRTADRIESLEKSAKGAELRARILKEL
ncbi:MAG: hypothetical protein NT067_07055 [Candidatus Diapherotrites archaeon]|nr:hypothetical protein [Candidatus Diapherotrites archaeon]